MLITIEHGTLKITKFPLLHESRLDYYNCLIQPIIGYLFVVWGNCRKQLLIKINKLMNKYARCTTYEKVCKVYPRHMWFWHPNSDTFQKVEFVMTPQQWHFSKSWIGYQLMLELSILKVSKYITSYMGIVAATSKIQIYWLKKELAPM